MQHLTLCLSNNVSKTKNEDSLLGLIALSVTEMWWGKCEHQKTLLFLLRLPKKIQFNQFVQHCVKVFCTSPLHVELPVITLTVRKLNWPRFQHPACRNPHHFLQLIWCLEFEWCNSDTLRTDRWKHWSNRYWTFGESSIPAKTEVFLKFKINQNHIWRSFPNILLRP